MERVTAYIPAYNVSEYLARTIEGLLAQTHPFDEILVIDDGSRDNSAEIASRYPQVTLIKHLGNQGLAAARNTAMRNARNDLVASVDADVVADKGWIATLLPHMNNPRVAGVGGILVEEYNLRWPTIGVELVWLRNGDHNISLIPVFSMAVTTSSESLRSWRLGGITNHCAHVARIRILLFGSEREVDLVYDPAARSTHLRHDNLKSILDMYWRWWKYGNQAYPKGVTLRSWLGHALFVHFRYNFLEPAKIDLRAGRLDLLALDLLALGYMPYRDFRLWMSHPINPTAQNS